MLLNVLVILSVIFIAYLWTQQGFLSSFLHLCCTIAAGAVAFGVWELLVYKVLLGVRIDLAWTLGLIVPFILSLLVFRIACDKLVPWDVKIDNTTNFVGGGVLGLVSGTISVGMIVIASGFLNMGAKFFGYQPVTTDANGSVVRAASLWYPADAITSKIFESLSVGGFTAGQSALARRQPDVYLQAGLVRMTNSDVSRTTISPEDVLVSGYYEVHGSTQELMTDTFQFDDQGDPMRQSAVRFDGSTRPDANSKILGLVMAFSRGGVEMTSQFVFGPNQVRLIGELGNGKIESFFPIAVVSRADAATTTAGRWRYDAPDVFIASPGQASQSQMAFEFLVPNDIQIVDLLVKNARIPASKIPRMSIEGMPAEGFTIESRDEAVRTMAILTGTPDKDAVAIERGGLSTDSSQRVTSVNTTNLNTLRETGIAVTSKIPSGVLHKSLLRGFKFGGKNNASIVSGKSSFQDASGSKAPTKLRVTDLVAPAKTRIVQVDISIRKATSPYGMARQKALTVVPPVLIDTLGQVYEAVGFYHNDGRMQRLEYDPSSSIRALSQLPSLSSSKPNDQVVLFFIVPKGVQIREFSLGGQETILELDPPLPV
jgi:hypothetical protein